MIKEQFLEILEKINGTKLEETFFNELYLLDFHIENSFLISEKDLKIKLDKKTMIGKKLALENIKDNCDYYFWDIYFNTAYDGNLTNMIDWIKSGAKFDNIEKQDISKTLEGLGEKMSSTKNLWEQLHDLKEYILDIEEILDKVEDLFLEILGEKNDK